MPAHNPDLDLEVFGSVVEAFAIERRTIEAAAAGALSLDHLQDLHTAIEKAGGTLASGVRATGTGSVGEFIEGCFGALQASIPPEVYQAVLGALNAKLRVCKATDLFALMTAVQQFTEPLRQINGAGASMLVPASPTATASVEPRPVDTQGEVGALADPSPAQAIANGGIESVASANGTQVDPLTSIGSGPTSRGDNLSPTLVLEHQRPSVVFEDFSPITITRLPADDSRDVPQIEVVHVQDISQEDQHDDSTAETSSQAANSSSQSIGDEVGDGMNADWQKKTPHQANG